MHGHCTVGDGELVAIASHLPLLATPTHVQGGKIYDRLCYCRS